MACICSAAAGTDVARRETPKIGRNDLCPCGSGEKFKKCQGAALEEAGSDDAQA
jgi:preprotein translocase subunit SecA